MQILTKNRLRKRSESEFFSVSKSEAKAKRRSKVFLRSEAMRIRFASQYFAKKRKRRKFFKIFFHDKCAKFLLVIQIRAFLFEYAKGKQLNVREMYFIFNYFPMLSVLFQFSESELWYISHQRWRKSALGRYTRFFCVWHFWLHAPHAPHALTLTLSKLKFPRRKARVITSELWLHSHTRVCTRRTHTHQKPPFSFSISLFEFWIFQKKINIFFFKFFQ